MNFKRAFIILVCSILCPILFVHLFDTVTVNYKGLEFALGFKMALKGSTTINIPPLGLLKAYTHPTPVEVNIVLKNINLDLLKALIDQAPDKRELLLVFENQLIDVSRTLILKTVILGLSGAIFAAGFFRLTKKELITSIIICLLFLTVVFTSTYICYDFAAFDRPEYLGTLKAAPWLIGLWDKGISQINELGQQLKNLSDGISVVFSRMDSLASTEESVVRVLHVSDIHNNPVAFDFMEQIINNFNVDFVIDTGDITDYGTPLEDLVIKRLAQLPIEYIFVSGNHDSPKIIELVNNIDNVLVLDDETTTVKGIKILGFSDPNSKTANIDSPKEVESLELNLKIHESLKSLNTKPDILAVHNPKSTENLSGIVPIILNGHTHKNSVKKENGSFIINAGTTGAAGIRGIQSKGEIPYSAVMLYFKKTEELKQPQLFAADIIKISNFTLGFQVERVFFNQEDEQ